MDVILLLETGFLFFLLTREQVPEQADPVSVSAMFWTGVAPGELLRSLLFCVVNRSRIRFPVVLSHLIAPL